MDRSNNVMDNVLVPTVIEKTPKGERAFDLFSRLMSDRILWLPADVNQASVQVLQGSLLHLESEDSNKPISLYINSPGGSVYDGNGLLDAMALVKPDIHTYCVGVAASFGALLLAAGTPGKRFATKRSRIMIHEVRSRAGGGTVTDMRLNQDEMELLNNNLIRDLYEWLSDDAPNKPSSKEELAEFMSRDRWMSAQEALDMGLIDVVL